MRVIENISLEEINGKIYKIRLIESIDYGKASLTHYLHNSTSGVSKYYKKSAHQYLKHLLELKYPEIEITNSVAEEAMQYLLFDYKIENIPFPLYDPEGVEFVFVVCSKCLLRDAESK